MYLYLDFRSFKGMYTRKCVCRPGSVRTRWDSSQRSPKLPSSTGEGEGTGVEGLEERVRERGEGREMKGKEGERDGGRRGWEEKGGERREGGNVREWGVGREGRKGNWFPNLSERGCAPV